MSSSFQSGGQGGSPPERTAALSQQFLQSAFSDRKRGLSAVEWLTYKTVAYEAVQSGDDAAEVTRKLVSAFVKLRFPDLSTQPEEHERMCREIAGTLSSDPYARGRMQEFQQHLLQS